MQNEKNYLNQYNEFLHSHDFRYYAEKTSVHYRLL